MQKGAPTFCEITALPARNVFASEVVDEVVMDFSFRGVPMNWHFDPSKGNFRNSACVLADVHILADVLRKGLAQVDCIRARSSHGHNWEAHPSLYWGSANH